MSIRVYHAGVNPSVERFSYRLSNNRGLELVGRGEGFLIKLEDGRIAIMLHRARAEREQWIERLEVATSSNLCPMPLLKWVPPVRTVNPLIAKVRFIPRREFQQNLAG